MMNSQLFLPMAVTPPCAPVMNTIPQAINSTTTVRSAVARCELTSLMPILARIVVSAANSADSSAYTRHIRVPSFRWDFIVPII